MKKPPYRPTKLTKKFIQVANEVINSDINAIIYTDEELLFLINEKLPAVEKVGNSTWEDWKAGKSPKKDTKNLDSFRALVKKALLFQRDSLFNSMRKDEKAWQKWAWIIERKFDDWNIRQKIDQDVKSDGKPLDIKVISYQDYKKNG